VDKGRSGIRFWYQWRGTSSGHQSKNHRCHNFNCGRCFAQMVPDTDGEGSLVAYQWLQRVPTGAANTSCRNCASLHSKLCTTNPRLALSGHEDHPNRADQCFPLNHKEVSRSGRSVECCKRCAKLLAMFRGVRRRLAGQFSRDRPRLQGDDAPPQRHPNPTDGQLSLSTYLP
jgi:hypothetical protein